VEAATVEMATVEAAKWMRLKWRQQSGGDYSGGGTVEVVAMNTEPVEVVAATAQGFFVVAEKSNMKNWQ